jgi:hypothetical protein
MKYLLQIVAAAVLLVLGKFIFSGDFGSQFIAEGIIIIVTVIIVDMGYYVYKNHKRVWLIINTQIFLRNSEIRFSIAYLYRIKIDGQYLLVKGRLRGKWQPVGGAFKTLPGSERVFEKLKVKPDRIVEVEKGIAKGDLRGHLPGVNLISFLDWFNSKADRETSPWREFCEELIVTNILPWQQFRHIDYKFMGTVQTPVIPLDTGNGKGIYHFEIYDLLPNDEQAVILRQLLSSGNTDNHIWVDSYLIERLGFDERTKSRVYPIAPHTKWALDLKWSGE